MGSESVGGKVKEVDVVVDVNDGKGPGNGL